jgi:xylulose-5-phosphate/fructose-6-phosphate phosphoketolase
LNFIYVHLNRAIKALDLDMIFVTGPGHGGPALVANAYLEGTYTEVYPNVSCDEDGMKRLFKQFSFPGGIPSHVAPETPGSIHEGGELGYALSHAYGAAFDNPNLIVACVVGDGEAETGPLATSWQLLGCQRFGVCGVGVHSFARGSSSLAFRSGSAGRIAPAGRATFRMLLSKRAR